MDRWMWLLMCNNLEVRSKMRECEQWIPLYNALQITGNECLTS